MEHRCQNETSIVKDNALYLMGSERCDLLCAAMDHSTDNTIDTFGTSIEGKTSRMGDYTRVIDFPS